MTSCPRSGKSCPYISFRSGHHNGLTGYHVCSHPKIKKLLQGKTFISIHDRGVWSIALPVDEIDKACGRPWCMVYCLPVDEIDKAMVYECMSQNK